MRDRLDHSAHRFVVRKNPDPPDLPQTERIERRLLPHRKPDAALHLADVEGCALLRRLLPGRHRRSPVRVSGATPRARATESGSLSWSRPSIVALITLCGLAVPRDFVRTSCTPRTS